MKNALSWFEIPVNDLERAKKFYSTVLDIEITDMPLDGVPWKYALFPYDQDGGIGGTLVKGEGYVPNSTGSVVYLNGNGSLSQILAKVEKAGGKVVLPRTPIGPYGFFAQFTDSEGNKVAIHSLD